MWNGQEHMPLSPRVRPPPKGWDGRVGRRPLPPKDPPDAPPPPPPPATRHPPARGSLAGSRGRRAHFSMSALVYSSQPPQPSSRCWCRLHADVVQYGTVWMLRYGCPVGLPTQRLVDRTPSTPLPPALSRHCRATPLWQPASLVPSHAASQAEGRAARAARLMRVALRPAPAVCYLRGCLQRAIFGLLQAGARGWSLGVTRTDSFPAAQGVRWHHVGHQGARQYIRDRVENS